MTLHERFATVARAHGARLAVTDGHGSLTYAELDALSARIAAAIDTLGTPADRLIALRAGRDRHTVAALLAILRSGRAYVPVDPGYPPVRQAYMLADSGARLVLGSEHPGTQRPAPEQPGPELEVLDRIGGVWLSATNPAIPAGPTVQTDLDRPGSPPPTTPDALAYVIYTSGSTGRPKGCMVGHDNALALFDAARDLFGFGPDDVWSVFHSFAFDFSVWELWGALLEGGTAVLVPRGVAADPVALRELLSARRVTVLNQTPTAFGYLVQELETSGARLPDLRHVVFGGEAVRLDDVRRWWKLGAAPQARLVNMYGITETTVHVTFRPLETDERPPEPGHTPIGEPLPHLEISLRDEDGQPVSHGAPGEIWVSGAGVCHGYLGREQLTGERFVTGDGRRWYRSGDLALRASDGLHYLHRADDQVKLRGHRIELGEVESVLAAAPGVRGCACALEKNDFGQDLLTAYLVGEPDGQRDLRQVRAHLSRELPRHMHPHRFAWLEQLPVNQNGKLDRAALSRAAG